MTPLFELQLPKHLHQNLAVVRQTIPAFSEAEARERAAENALIEGAQAWLTEATCTLRMTEEEARAELARLNQTVKWIENRSTLGHLGRSELTKAEQERNAFRRFCEQHNFLD